MRLLDIQRNILQVLVPYLLVLHISLVLTEENGWIDLFNYLKNRFELTDIRTWWGLLKMVIGMPISVAVSISFLTAYGFLAVWLIQKLLYYKKGDVRVGDIKEVGDVFLLVLVVVFLFATFLHLLGFP